MRLEYRSIVKTRGSISKRGGVSSVFLTSVEDRILSNLNIFKLIDSLFSDFLSRIIIKKADNITFDFNLSLLARTQRSKKREVEIS